ncbi:MAG: aminotransferase class V-fold PLP-dependent enzyme, partial [bacterium]|nr:aminotransferase class V-fold PLP-dependent enzyme [bacterium]
MERRDVYLDNNATTRVDDRVAEEMNRYFLQDYAVASSQFSHTPGIKAKDAVDKARFLLAEKINAKIDEIVFTSGATEANNLALKGIAKAFLSGPKKKVIISQVEHFSVLDSARALEKLGFKIEYVKVNNEGFVDLDHLASLLD